MKEIKSKLTDVGYELESVYLVQDECSGIVSRSECDTKIDVCGKKVHPVFVAPMGAVTDENNYKVWLDAGFMCVIPRTVDLEKRIALSEETFVSFSLSEAEEVLYNLPQCNEETIPYKRYVCIDIAHGTMYRLYHICRELKKLFGNNMIIMTGNVATPRAYRYYANAGIDYMRACIGTGSRCTTSCNVGVHYPTATLIDRLRMEKECWEGDYGMEAPTKIIADGGITNFDDIQKCLALGADAVMSGSNFAKAEEACGEIVMINPDNPLDYMDEETWKRSMDFLLTEEAENYFVGDCRARRAEIAKFKRMREYYGMSTRRAQTETGGSGTKTSEGIIKPVPVEYPIAKWASNMSDYLASAMSYTGNRTIEELKENTELIVGLSGDRSFRK